MTNNVSVAGGNEPANNAGNNSFADTTYVYYAPTIAKTFAPTTVVAGLPSTLTLTIGNPAGNTVSLLGAAITDNFPAGHVCRTHAQFYQQLRRHDLIGQ